MRILIYNWRDLAHPKAGGAEVYTDQIARHWVEAGHDVTLFCSAIDGKSERETVDGGYQVVRRGSPHGVYGEARKYWEREARGHFDLVIDEVNTRPFGCPRWVTEVPVIALIHQVAREIWFHETLWPIALVGRYWLEPHWLADSARIQEQIRAGRQIGQGKQIHPVGARQIGAVLHDEVAAQHAVQVQQWHS